MATGKAFRRKMKKAKVGHSFWYIHGVPVPLNIANTYGTVEQYCQRYYKHSVLICGYIFFTKRCTGGMLLHNPTEWKPVSLGGLHKHFRTPIQAMKFIMEMKDGLHADAVSAVVEYHRALDMFDSIFEDIMRGEDMMRPDDDDLYTDAYCDR